MATESSASSIAAIIPVYNSEQSIIRALYSVEYQTRRPDQVIIVDDCSTDSSYVKILEFKKRSALNIILIKLEFNSGVSVARNHGIEFAKAEYLAFLDSDDTWEPEKLDTQLSLMIKNGWSISAHDFKNEGFEYNNFRKNPEISYIGRSLLLGNKFVTPSVMIKNYSSLRFDDDLRYMEDYSAWLNCYFMYGKIPYIKLPLVRLYKPQYGHSGLSSHMWEMEKSELSVLFMQYKLGRINFFTMMAIVFWSVIKFLRRKIIVRKISYGR